jgi:hypothetical protein
LRNRANGFSAHLLDEKYRVSRPAGIQHSKEQLMKDDLDKLLKSWHPEVPTSAAFKRQVWVRIERCRRAAGFFESFVEWFTRPQVAAVAAAVSVLGGAWIGLAVAPQDGQTAYLHSVDPYAQISLK